MKQSENLLVPLKVGARSSKLSKVQVEEVKKELESAGIHLVFECTYLETIGDRDRSTSLKTMEKSDFFTREIDALLLSGAIDIAIHSAKDLPDPLHPDLIMISLTQGKDPSDSLVMEYPYTIQTLPLCAKIGTSSTRREENLQGIRSDFTFVDIRGTIEERIDLFRQKKIDALVVAEAALLRLGYHHLHREKIPGPVALHQGRLAIVGRKDKSFLYEAFKAIDSRK